MKLRAAGKANVDEAVLVSAVGHGAIRAGQGRDRIGSGCGH